MVSQSCVILFCDVSDDIISTGTARSHKITQDHTNCNSDKDEYIEMAWSREEKRRSPGGKETERKAQVRVDQQHQQSPGGKETERKAHVTVDQQHQQSPGGKET